MNPSDDIQDHELLERYRQASSAEPLAPHDAVRAAILEEGRRAAASFAQPSAASVRHGPSRWKWTAFATAASVLLAALVIAPRLWEREGHGVNAGSLINPFKQAAQRKSQPDPSEYASSAPVPVVPVQPAPAPARPSPPPPSALGSKGMDARRSAFAGPSAPPIHYPEQSAEISMLNQSRAASRPSAQEFAGRSGGSSGALLAAASAGDSAKAAQLLDQHAFVDERDDAGRTPLMLAVEQGQLDMVRLLLERGADPNAADRTGVTPLKHAQQKGRSAIAAVLTQAGAR